jgi:hypothetical protein
LIRGFQGIPNITFTVDEVVSFPDAPISVKSRSHSTDEDNDDEEDDDAHLPNSTPAYFHPFAFANSTHASTVKGGSPPSSVKLSPSRRRPSPESK